MFYSLCALGRYVNALEGRSGPGLERWKFRGPDEKIGKADRLA